MNIIEILEKPKGNREQFESFKRQQHYVVINGEVIEDSNINEYNKNGEVLIEGSINGEPIYYSNVNMINPTEQFSENKVYIMNITKPVNKRLSRRKTPYSKRKMLKMVKMVKKRKTNKKKSIRKRNKR
jgi:hypothetical protein